MPGKVLKKCYLFQGDCTYFEQSFSLFGELGLDAVVGDAVLQNQFNVSQEFAAVVVLVTLDLLGHRFEIHGLLDDAVVVFDELLVDRFQEGPGFRYRFQLAIDDAVQHVGERNLYRSISNSIVQAFQ